MKKIGKIIILLFLIVSSGSIFFTLYLGRFYEDFDDDDDDEDEYEEEDDKFDKKALQIYLFSMIGCILLVPRFSKINIIFRLNKNLISSLKSLPRTK